MKKKILSAVGIALTCMALMTGCQQTMAKSFGGNMTLTLDPGQKLELIMWIDIFERHQEGRYDE